MKEKLGNFLSKKGGGTVVFQKYLFLETQFIFAYFIKARNIIFNKIQKFIF